MVKENGNFLKQQLKVNFKLFSFIGSIILAIITATDFIGNFILFIICNIDFQYIQLNSIYEIIARTLASLLIFIICFYILRITILKRRKIVTKVLCGLCLNLLLSACIIICITITDNSDIRAWLGLDGLYIVLLIGILLFAFTIIAQVYNDMIVFFIHEINVTNFKQNLKHIAKNNSKKLVYAALILILVCTYYSYSLKSEVVIFDKQTSNIDEYVNEIPSLTLDSKYAIIAKFDNKFIVQKVVSENKELVVLDKEQYYIIDIPILEINNSDIKAIKAFN